MTSLALQAKSLTLGYESQIVVSGLDLSVDAGEILVVVGSSGCGKSTLLRAFAGLLSPIGGTIEAGGSAVRGPSSERALVFQDDALLPWRSVRRNVELPLAVRGIPRQTRRQTADVWLDRVGLDGKAKRLPRELSGGMRQRVQLARALAGAPGVILMDEPFGALDAQSRETMQRLLVEAWSASPTTVVFVTHDVDEALRLGDRVVVLDGSGVRTEVRVPKPRDFSSPVDAGFRATILASLGVASLADA
jgi:NitT/TauT family transport system ATP-binding protein